MQRDKIIIQEAQTVKIYSMQDVTLLYLPVLHDSKMPFLIHLHSVSPLLVFC